MPILPLSRRRLLLQSVAWVPLPFVARRLHALAIAALDPRTLRALGAAVLPSELGPTGIERVVAGFERWLAGYREGVELVHGYGTEELRSTGPSPAARWTTQVLALEAEARSRHTKAFAQLSIAERQSLVRAVLEGQRIGSLTQFDRAPHVALGLLGYFYSSPEAADLCYQARIGANTCRPLADSSRQPVPLTRSN